MSFKNKQNIDEVLQFFLTYAPTFKEVFNEDVDITVTDREQVLEHLLSKDLPVESSKGRVLNQGEPILNVIRTNKKVRMEVPGEHYGVPFTATMVPIRGKSGEVIGAFGLSQSTNKQEKLKEVAVKFADSSEEISDSTEALADSAVDFSAYMKELSEAQHDMHQQVEATRKILEMINGVAKNTRVLGFNAGIEAARSGEHGHGFAIVAKEVTRLAEESANSVNEIRDLLEELNHKVNNVATIVESTVEISTNQTTTIQAISESIQGLTDGAEEIEKLAKNI